MYKHLSRSIPVALILKKKQKPVYFLKKYIKLILIQMLLKILEGNKQRRDEGDKTCRNAGNVKRKICFGRNEETIYLYVQSESKTQVLKRY